MKSIRLKVKHILLIIGLMALLVFFANDIYFIGAKTYSSFTNDMTVFENMTFDSITNENKRLELILTEHDHSLVNFVVTGDGMSMGGSRIKYHDGLKIKETYDIFQEGKNLYQEEIDYTLNVILTQWLSGHSQIAMDMMKRVDMDALDTEQKDQYHLIQAAMDLTYFRLDDVVKELEYVSDDYYDAKEIIKTFMATAYEYDIDHEIVDPSESRYSKYFLNLSYMLDNVRYSNVSNGDDIVEGQVTVNGQPLAGAFVYPSYHNGMSSNEGFSEDGQYIGPDGKYSLKVNKTRLDSIRIAIPWQRIMDKSRIISWDQNFDQPLNFEFEEGIRFEYVYIEDDHLHYKIANADDSDYIMKIQYFEPDFFNDQSYYTLTEPQGIISMDDIKREMTFAFNTSSSPDTLDMNRFYEHFYLSGNYGLMVNKKLDDPGRYVNNGMMSESLYTLITYNEGHLPNQGDQLMIEDKYQEAMAWYSQNPSRHNLNVLYNLYYHGNIPFDGEYEQYLEGQNFELALKYLNDLIALDGPSYKRLNDLADILGQLKMYDEKSEALNALQVLSPSVYTELQIAYNEIDRGNYLLGIDMLKTFDIHTLGDRYIEYFLLIDEREGLPEDIVTLLEDVDSSAYNDFIELVKLGDYDQAYLELKEHKNSSMKAYFELLLLSNLPIEDLPYEVSKDHFKRYKDRYDYHRSLADQIKDELRSVIVIIRQHSSLFN